MKNNNNMPSIQFIKPTLAGRDKLILTSPSPFWERGEHGLITKKRKESLPV
jgi:hypothetical protein